MNYFYSIWTFGFFLVFLFCVLWLLKPQKHKSFKALNLFWFCFCMTNHIATYITFYLYHNNISLTTQYLHCLRLSELLNTTKHSTLFLQKKRFYTTDVKLLICYSMQYELWLMQCELCSYCFSVEDSPFPRKQGCPYFLFFKIKAGLTQNPG